MDNVRPIDANALCKWLRSSTGFASNCEDCCEIDCVDCIIEEAIKNEPTLDYAPVRHGNWIECPTYDEDGYYCIDYKCSECGRFVPIEEPYCHCGSKMDGGNQDV